MSIECNREATQGGERMSERQQEALKKIMDAIPKMSEFERGRLYGRAEAMEEENLKKAKEEKEMQEAG
jgi:hypothetical protein